MFSGGSDLLQNSSKTAWKVEADFKLPGYDSAGSFLLPFAINTKAEEGTISHPDCRCLNQPHKISTRTPYVELREWDRCPQRSSEEEDSACPPLFYPALTSGRGDSPLEILKIFFDRWGFSHPFARVFWYNLCLAHRKQSVSAQAGCLKKLFLPLFLCPPGDTV